MILSNEEKSLVRDLNRNPVFASLMQKAVAEGRIPAYKPKDTGDQEGNWKYRSGYARGIEFVINLLGYNDER